MHLSEGEIRAYLDRELPAIRQEQAEAHLEVCLHCKQQAEALFVRARRVDEQLAALAPSTDQSPRPVSVARQRLTTRLTYSEKESESMFKSIFSRYSRSIWAAVGSITLLAVALAFPQVRAIANNFLGLFRVQQVAVVEINPANLPHQLGSSSQLEKMMTDNVKFDSEGEEQEVASLEEASQVTGMPVRTLGAFENPTSLTVSPSGKINFNVNLEQVQLLMSEIGRSDIQIPAEIDGAAVEVEVLKGVVALYGNCPTRAEMMENNGGDPDDPDDQRMPYLGLECTSLMQMPSPTISAPPGLNLSQIGEVYLEILGMSREEAAQIASTIDWTTTMVVPIPRYRAIYQDVMVDGVHGTLIRQTREDSTKEYMLMWVKDGVVYVLTGTAEDEKVLELANSLQ